jgi:hypothetical protein
MNNWVEHSHIEKYISLSSQNVCKNIYRAETLYRKIGRFCSIEEVKFLVRRKSKKKKTSGTEICECVCCSSGGM